MTRPSLEVWVPREGRAGDRPRSLSRTTLQWTSAETYRRGEGAPPSPPVRKEPQPPTPRTHQLRSVQRGQRVCWARNCSASPAPKGSSPGDSGISGICCTPGSCPSWKGGPPKQAAPRRVSAFQGQQRHLQAGAVDEPRWGEGSSPGRV